MLRILPLLAAFSLWAALGVGPAWHPIVRAADEPSGWQAHPTRVIFVAYSADGDRIFSADWDGAIKAWEAKSAKELAVLQRKNGRSTMVAAAFTPVGQVLASGMAVDGKLPLWDAKTLQPLQQLPDEGVGCSALAFSPDGKVLAAASPKQPLRLWDIPAGKPLAAAQEKLPLAYALAFAPDGKTLAIGANAKTVLLWDVAANRVRATLAGDADPDWVKALAYSPDGKLLATSHKGSFAVIIWDVGTGKQKYQLDLRKHGLAATALAFSPDGRILALACPSGKAAYLWDVVAERELPELEGLGKRRFGSVVAFSPDGKKLVTGGSDGRIAIWDVPAVKP